MENKTEKTIYVNKYDYMHYYTRCEQIWFLPNAKIDKLITDVEKPLKEKLGIKDDLDDDEEENENSLTDYEAMQEAKINGVFDDQKILQEKDLKILEGIIIDKQAKDFIIGYYQKQVANDSIRVIDYDEINSNQIENANNSNENKDINLLRANQTQKDIRELLDKNKKFILFQPTFIAETPDKHAKYVTRCDCIVYLGKNQCYLIEVKGTSSSKLIHLLDLLYQKNVLKQSILHITNYCLCLVKYDRSDKKDIPFIVDPFINTSKSNKNLSDGKKDYFDLILDHAFNESDPKELKKKLKNVDEMEISLKQNYKLGKEHLLINNALNNDWNFDLISLSYILNGSSNKSASNYATNFIKESKDKINPLIDNFYDVINTLSHQKSIYHEIEKLELKPCGNCTSCYKNCEFWNRCKKIFKYEYLTGNKELLPFGYSAEVFKNLKSDSPLDESENKQFNVYERIKTKDVDQKINVNDFESISSVIKEDFIPFFKDQDNNKYMDDVKQLWDKLQSRPNRVYFDFESINSAIPPMDWVFPLTQVVTQNSVIKTEVRGNNHYYEYENELKDEINNKQKSKSSDQMIAETNMIRDPTKLNTKWLKDVIDRLIDTKHPVDAANPTCTTWYIVYNKTFESNRLHEMDLIIKEKEYHDKIELIRNNIFDLEDFFNTKQKAKKLLISKLRGFYSIKDILPLIPESIRKETKTVDYHEDLVEVHNGQQAQQVTTRRFLNLFNDVLFKDKNNELMSEEEWKKAAEELKKYCENDVRAMIAVEKYIKEEFIDKIPKQ